MVVVVMVVARKRVSTQRPPAQRTTPGRRAGRRLAGALSIDMRPTLRAMLQRGQQVHLQPSVRRDVHRVRCTHRLVSAVGRCRTRCAAGTPSALVVHAEQHVAPHDVVERRAVGERGSAVVPRPVIEHVVHVDADAPAREAAVLQVEIEQGERRRAAVAGGAQLVGTDQRAVRAGLVGVAPRVAQIGGADPIAVRPLRAGQRGGLGLVGVAVVGLGVAAGSICRRSLASQSTPRLKLKLPSRAVSSR